MEHVKGISPVDLYEARRPHNENDHHGEELCKAAQRYLQGIQGQIQANVVFGLLKDIGSTDM